MLRFTNRCVLARVEQWLAPDETEPLLCPPIFFLGAPRCGSTLATQLITETLELGYLSNSHCQWYGAPAIAERLLKPTSNRPPSDFRSRYGTTYGTYAPAECGEWWYRFFQRDPTYVPLASADAAKMRSFRRSVAAMIDIIRKPLLFKNLYASMRIQPIARWLPESLFVVCHRDEVDNGHSLLEARYHLRGDYAQWFSVKPPSIAHLRKLPAHEQVIEQVRHIRKTIEEDFAFAEVDVGRRFEFAYEDLCRDPREVLGRFRQFLRTNGCEVPWRADPPGAFEPAKAMRIDQELYRRMVGYARAAG